MRRDDLLLLVAAVLGGLLFFGTLPRTWPLVDADLVREPATLEARARAVLAERGFDAPELVVGSRLSVSGSTLAYVEETFGRARAQALVREPNGLVTWEVLAVRAGDPEKRRVSLHPDGRVVGFSRDVEDDAPGASLDGATARALAVAAVADTLALDVATWRERSDGARVRPERVDHTFAWERTLSERPELRETVYARVAGDVVVDVSRRVLTPAAGRRAAVAAAAVPKALGTLGKALVVVTGVLACAVFVRRLRAGRLDLGTPARWTLALFAGHLLLEALDGYALLAAWQPLWPRAVSVLEHVVDAQVKLAWAWLVLFVVIAAAAAVDAEPGGGRARSLWALGRGELRAADVAADCVRGFGLGLVCGGLVSAAVLALEGAGGRVALQPRGFLLDVVDRDLPALAALLFVARVALVEELGYRLFGTTWLLQRTGRVAVAVLVPALVYGLSHADLSFLPPADPAWGRAVVMTLVGVVWGLAFLRWGALVVVVSHLTADLFLFTWPRLAGLGVWTPSPELVVFLAPLAVGLALLPLARPAEPLRT